MATIQQMLDQQGLGFATDGLTAHASGGQNNGPAANASMLRFSTVATIGDSYTLPASTAGRQIDIANASTNSMNVFPATGDAINALAVNTAFALAGGKTACFMCFTAGQWHAILSA